MNTIINILLFPKFFVAKLPKNEYLCVKYSRVYRNLTKKKTATSSSSYKKQKMKNSPKKKENQLINLSFNIVIPILILTRLSKEEYLGPIWALLIALLFPTAYGLYRLIIQKQKSLISIIGFIGILLTGVLGIMKFPPHWIAVKEASIPLLIGLFVLFSTNTSWQLITRFLYTREIFDIDRIQNVLNSDESKTQLKNKLKLANTLLALSFFISSALNYSLAKIIVQSMPGTPQFNEEIGRMTMLSFPAIALPSVGIMLLIFLYLISSIKKLTSLSSNEILSEKFRDNK
jgi:hypothetical protein